MYRKKRDWLTIRESEAPGRGELILPPETVHAILTTASLPLFRGKNPRTRIDNIMLEERFCISEEVFARTGH